MMARLLLPFLSAVGLLYIQTFAEQQFPKPKAAVQYRSHGDSSKNFGGVSNIPLRMATGFRNNPSNTAAVAVNDALESRKPETFTNFLNNAWTEIESKVGKRVMWTSQEDNDSDTEETFNNHYVPSSPLESLLDATIYEASGIIGKVADPAKFAVQVAENTTYEGMNLTESYVQEGSKIIQEGKEHLMNSLQNAAQSVEAKTVEGLDWAEEKFNSTVDTVSEAITTEEKEVEESINAVETDISSYWMNGIGWIKSILTDVSNSFTTILRVLEVVGFLVFLWIFIMLYKKAVVFQSFFSGIFRTNRPNPTSPQNMGQQMEMDTRA